MLLFSAVITVFFVSCGNPNQSISSENRTRKTNCGACTEAELAAMTAALDGDVETFKSYLDNGGDPELCCKAMVVGDRPTTPGVQYLYIKTMTSESLPMLKCYLSYDLPRYIINELLNYYIVTRNPQHVELLLDYGGDINDDGETCCGICLENIAYLEQFDYDFNWVNPENGNTLLMEYAACPTVIYETEIIEIMDYLIEQGARLDIKNHEGKTAIDLATDEKIKAYLLGLE